MTADPSERQVIARRLYEARTTLGLTQEDVATTLGIQRSAVCHLEKGQRNVTGLELRRLSRLYRCPVAWLLGEDDGPEPDADLVAATAGLGEQDRVMVLRFARFLAQQNGGQR